MPACPLGASLTAVASEHFAFHSAQEYEEEAMPVDRTPERLQAVESAISELRAGIQTLLDANSGEPTRAGSGCAEVGSNGWCQRRSCSV